MRLGREIMMAGAMTAGAVFGAGCSAHEDKAPTDASGIAVTRQNAEAREAYLQEKTLADMQKALNRGKIAVARGLCVGWETKLPDGQPGYNIVIDPASYSLDTDEELFSMVAFPEHPQSTDITQTGIITGPDVYVQKDSQGRQLSDTQLGYRFDKFEYTARPNLEEVEVRVGDMPPSIQSDLHTIVSVDTGKPVMFGMNIGVKPTNFEAACRELAAEVNG